LKIGAVKIFDKSRMLSWCGEDDFASTSRERYEKKSGKLGHYGLGYKGAGHST
jgi:hypothetical protein